ncbi:DUF2207 domain-containing protein, partial [Candidatus Saccharibacteria bacterium]|nr:DUF2207 domain-containing protein [Candidatus Saccharibacteria bacterium]
MAQGVQDFVITNFDASYELSNEDPQGLLTTRETIDLNFSGQNHGILRAIPQKYGDVDTHPKVKSVSRDGAAEPYVTYSENDNLVLRIGDAGKFITGVHSYAIEYSVENVITFYDDQDE